MKSAKTIVIAAALVFAALSLSVHSAERDDSTPARVTPPRRPPTRTPSPTTPTRPTSRTTPTRPSARPGASRPTPARRVRPPEDPHKDSVILVEAFMVQVRLSSLRSLGVPQISEGCKSVSAGHIIKLMKTTDAAVVKAGAKVAVGQKNKARTESTTRKAIYTDPPDNEKIEYIEVGTSFTAIAEIRKEKVFAELEFQYSDIVKADKNTNATPQNTVERKWGSTICLKPGEPTIVGATQDKDSAAFLIVTANIRE